MYTKENQRCVQWTCVSTYLLVNLKTLNKEVRTCGPDIIICDDGVPRSKKNMLCNPLNFRVEGIRKVMV